MSTGKRDDPTANPPPSGERREDFLALFKKGLKFTEELLAENEKLRYRVASLEAENQTLHKSAPSEGGDPLIAALKRQIAELEAERQSILTRYAEVEATNRDYQARYVEIEEEHNNLANLYIASYQLHSTLHFPDVLQVVSEIVINLVGVARFAIYLTDAPTRTLHPVFTEGHTEQPKPVLLGEGAIGRAVAEKARTVSEDGTEPLAVIPLATLETVVGAIVIDELLVQKQGFSAVDHELFTLLGAHAATALLSALIRHKAGDVFVEEALTVAHARQLLSP